MGNVHFGVFQSVLWPFCTNGRTNTLKYCIRVTIIRLFSELIKLAIRDLFYVQFQYWELCLRSFGQWGHILCSRLCQNKRTSPPETEQIQMYFWETTRPKSFVVLSTFLVAENILAMRRNFCFPVNFQQTVLYFCVLPKCRCKCVIVKWSKCSAILKFKSISLYIHPTGQGGQQASEC